MDGITIHHSVDMSLSSFRETVKDMDFPGGSDGEVSACNAVDPGPIHGLGRSHGEGNGNPLQYSCLENPMDGGVWWATLSGVTELDMTEQLN